MIDFFRGLIDYFAQNSGEILKLTMEHIQLTFISVAVAILIAMPLGILISYIEALKKPVLAIANVVQAIPSLALLGFLIPFLGIGQKPAVFMIVVYSLLPIIKNTATGLGNINKETLEAAKGIGMSPAQVLFKVKLPLSLPVIMAGIRISAVASVGLVTIAAFVGAGGLGYLVYAGIRTVSTYQILAGAIPACLIALLMDKFMAFVESAVTPISLRQKSSEITEKNVKKQKRDKVISAAILVILAAVMILSSVIPHLNKVEKTVVIGSKNFTEQEIVAEMMSLLIQENTDFKVERKKALGSTSTILSALEEGSLDLSVDYTGTIYGNVMGKTENIPRDEMYDVSKEYLAGRNFVALDTLGFNNTYTFAVRKETAEKYGLKTFSDLAEVSDELVVGCTIEFMNRPDGLPGAIKAYDFKFISAESIDDSPRYIAIDNDNVQVIDAFSTDAMLLKYGLVALEDDRSFFPAYDAFPIIRQETLEKYPELGEALAPLTDMITDDEMVELNYQADEMGEKPEDVARQFLLGKGLIQ